MSGGHVGHVRETCHNSVSSEQLNGTASDVPSLLGAPVPFNRNGPVMVNIPFLWAIWLR